jgi:hypothetical protein
MFLVSSEIAVARVTLPVKVKPRFFETRMLSPGRG